MSLWALDIIWHISNLKRADRLCSSRLFPWLVIIFLNGKVQENTIQLQLENKRQHLIPFLTSVTQTRPSKNIRTDRKSISGHLLWRKYRGKASTIEVLTVSKMVNWLSSPSVKSMRKKSIAQSGDTGSWAIASGYATKARPNPVVYQKSFSYFL